MILCHILLLLQRYDLSICFFLFYIYSFRDIVQQEVQNLEDLLLFKVRNKSQTRNGHASVSQKINFSSKYNIYKLY